MPLSLSSRTLVDEMINFPKILIAGVNGNLHDKNRTSSSLNDSPIFMIYT